MNNSNVLFSTTYGTMIVNKNDSGVGEEIFNKGYIDPGAIGALDKLIKLKLAVSDSVLLYDVGANIGTYSLALSKMNRSRFNVRAFEAQRPVYNMLCGNMAINGLNNVFCHNNAISDVEGEILELSLPDYSLGQNFGSLELMKPARVSDNSGMVRSTVERVRTLTIDSINENVDFIKIDIEGMEDRAIRGGARTILNSRPVCYIEIFKTDYRVFVDFFKDLNYVAFTDGGNAFLIPNDFPGNYEDILSDYRPLTLDIHSWHVLLTGG